MKRTNLEAYKDLLTEMNEKETFKFLELSRTPWDVFNVLQKHGYIKKVDKALYTWVGKKPTRATAKRVAMLTIEYRKSWASSQKDKKDVKDLQTKLNFQTPKPKQTDKRQNREQLAAIGTIILVTAIALILVIKLIFSI
jgi:ribosomal protein S8